MYAVFAILRDLAKSVKPYLPTKLNPLESVSTKL